LREISINGYIDDEVWFGDEITPDALHDLLYAEGKDHTDDVHIRLNSYGGSCNAAVRMHDDLAAYPGKVTITVSGTAASAATVLCMAADRLEMTPGSLWMIHDPSIIAMGNERDLKDAIRLLEACKDSILNVYERRIKITREQAAALMTRTTWMDAQKALEDGFIDGILSVRQAGPTDCVVTQADAEQKVAAWLERHKVSASAVTERVHTSVAVLREADAPPRAVDETPEPIEQHENDQNGAITDRPNETGTPVSQLKKRLALIMPTEAKYKE
jgi:ATP-dependent Clp protease protease subunit